MKPTLKPIDTQKFAAHLRDRCINVSKREILISRLSGSDQEADITLPTNCEGYGRIRRFRFQTSDGWPRNPLPIEPACKALGIKPVPEEMFAQVFQNAACAWRCWYCFVPEDLLRADQSRSSWLSPERLVSLYAGIEERPLILDLSGGSPDLVPEWTPWMMRALRQKGIDQSTYLWTDDNLSTTYIFDKLDKRDLDLIRTYRNYGRVCCFKGYDSRSFAFNTRATEDGFDNQFAIMRRMLDLGLDIYGYATLTSPHSDGVESGVSHFIDRLQELDENLPLRLIPLQIQEFTPVERRVSGNAERLDSFKIQEQAIAAWMTELDRRYDATLRSRSIADVPLKSRPA